jgi:hypothetical protein
MSAPGEWERIRALFHSALERAPAERAAFVRLRCGRDDRLRREVEALLAAHDEAAGFMAEALATAPRLPPGTRLDGFEIEDLIGAGGTGEVYRAHDTRLQRTVAIKVLVADLVGNPRVRERFERESRVVAGLNHPNICALYDAGAAMVRGGEVQYLVMELIEGDTLAARLARGPLPVGQSVRFAAQIAGALAAAHSLGVVHRDLKPANVMLTRAGVKLLDFGLARLRGLPAGRPTAASAEEIFTEHGIILGTLPYLAPEQVRGLEADAASDLFALGAIVHEMVTGEPAFTGESQARVIAAILEQPPAPLAAKQPMAPPALERLVASCLAKDPSERPRSARELAIELEEIGSHVGRGATATPAAPVRAASASGPRWHLHAAWALAVVLSCLILWRLLPAPSEPVRALPAPAVAAPPNPQPVVVLMDSPLPGLVYDPRTLAAGGTNADDVGGALRGLSIVTHKESTSAMWSGEEEVVRQRPDLVISHLACMLDARAAAGSGTLEHHLFDLAQTRLALFFAYVAASSPRTRFLVYSRGRAWPDPERESAWVRDVIARFPVLEGRLFTLMIPGDDERATFRDPGIARALRARVDAILGAQ